MQENLKSDNKKENNEKKKNVKQRERVRRVTDIAVYFISSF